MRHGVIFEPDDGVKDFGHQSFIFCLNEIRSFMSFHLGCDVRLDDTLQTSEVALQTSKIVGKDFDLFVCDHGFSLACRSAARKQKARFGGAGFLN